MQYLLTATTQQDALENTMSQIAGTACELRFIFPDTFCLSVADKDARANLNRVRRWLLGAGQTTLFQADEPAIYDEECNMSCLYLKIVTDFSHPGPAPPADSPALPAKSDHFSAAADVAELLLLLILAGLLSIGLLT